MCFVRSSVFSLLVGLSADEMPVSMVLLAQAEICAFWPAWLRQVVATPTKQSNRAIRLWAKHQYRELITFTQADR